MIVTVKYFKTFLETFKVLNVHGNFLNFIKKGLSRLLNPHKSLRLDTLKRSFLKFVKTTESSTKIVVNMRDFRQLVATRKKTIIVIGTWHFYQLPLFRLSKISSLLSLSVITFSAFSYFTLKLCSESYFLNKIVCQNFKKSCFLAGNIQSVVG